MERLSRTQGKRCQTMPELPDIAIYLEALQRTVVGQRLQAVRLFNPFLLRSADPPLGDVLQREVLGLRRLGKRIVFVMEADLFMVLHLMIAGRLRWKKLGAKPPGKVGLAAFDFAPGTLLLTEASSKKRASLHLVRGEVALADHDPGGLEVVHSALADFRSVLLAENHTLKRALTDPRLFSGIGNAYSDEILHRAELSPIKWTQRLTDDEIARLHKATVETLDLWTQRLRDEVGNGFPDKVTAFREGMAVHGRYRQPCPRCASPVQRIRRADNELNYCATCQTQGKLLADRGLSRLLKGDWPKTLEAFEKLKRTRRDPGSG